LVENFQIRQWNTQGLFRDSTSTENAVIALKGRRWPLIIDPQDYAKQWIKQSEVGNDFKVREIQMHL